MSSQEKREEIRSPEVSPWVTHHAPNGAIAVSFVLGYLIAIMDTHNLTLINFLAFTAVNVLCGTLLWWTNIRRDMAKWLLALILLGAALLAFISGLFILAGMGFNWLLYFVVVATFFTHLSIRNATIASAILYVGVGVNMFLKDGWNAVSPGWVSIAAGFCFVAAFTLANRLLDSERKRSGRLLRQLETSNSELEQAHRQLQAYADEVEELAVVRERTRLAREIHDTLGHYLTIINIQLETISKLQERNRAQALAEVEEAKRVAAQCMQEVRNAVAALRPMSIAKLNLIEALAQLGNEFMVVSPDIEFTLDQDTTLPPLSPEIQLAFYRAAQEALTNVRKHAQAKKVLVRLRYEDEILELVVRDNGNGSSQERVYQRTGGFGLIGLRERIELLGGQVTHGPLEPSGYRVTMSIRIPQTQTNQAPSHQVEQKEAV